MINEITKQYNDASLQLVADSINMHHKLLVEDPSKALSKLPENIFKAIFLPYFCGEKNVNDDPSILVKWISIAGNPTKEVQIIDNSGKELFTVPPLVDTNFIDVNNEKKGQPFFSIIANYELHKNQLPVVGENYLKNSIDARYQTLTKDSATHSLNEKRWNDIFVLYGKVKDTTVDSTVDTGKLLDDEMTFD